MLILQQLGYIHADKTPLFNNLRLTIQQHDKIALVGNNGSGKSTLLKIIAGALAPSEGIIQVDVQPYYVPQIFGQFNQLTIARALRIEDKLAGLKAILAGVVTEENYAKLDDDWTIEERCTAALDYWDLQGLDLTQRMETLSGGQKTKVFLAGISIHQPAFILLDEPSNHLDIAGRDQLYAFIRSATATMIIVSHDRTLLSLLDTVCELSNRGISIYGGNYDFYVAQKIIEQEALNADVKTKEKALRKAKEKERETMERQQKLDARGKKKQEKAGVPTIMMNTLRNNAEKSTAKIKGAHTEKIGDISRQLQSLRSELPEIDQMRFGFDSSGLHNGKILFRATDINFGYNDRLLWQQSLDIQIDSGERIALKGANGSGKTTLIKIILGRLIPPHGTVYSAFNRSVYIDQDYSLIDNQLSVYAQAQQFNTAALQEHEIKIRLNRFLFTKEHWDKSCRVLSGGEKMRLILCCLTISQQAPEIIILDEPTNNLDLQNIEILTAAIHQYQGTLIVVSHDRIFLEQVHTERTIEL